MTTGKFITFEGGEGSGKSTQAAKLAEHLRARGIDVVETREPGGSPFAEELRSFILGASTPEHSPLTEALLFYAARADHLEKTIRPALNAGRWVICDRFSDSTRAYQSAAGGLPPETIDALENMVVDPTFPDLTAILDLPAEAGLARAESRRLEKRRDAEAADPYERRDLEFHWNLREAFAAIARADPHRCALIDGAAEASAVAQAIWHAVERRLLAGVP